MGTWNRTKTIGMFMIHLEGRYTTPIYRAVQEVVSEMNASLLLFPGKALESDIDNEAQFNVIYKLARPELLDGLIVITGTLVNFVGEQKLLQFLEPYRALPMVSVSIDLPGIPSVMIDNASGMTELMNHLIHDHGYRRIGFLGGPETNLEARVRHQVYMDSLRKANLEYRPEFYCEGNFRDTCIPKAMNTFFDRKDLELDCLCAANDEMLVPLYHQLEKRGYRIPADLAMTGYDDIGDVRILTPGFTTVRQPLMEQGRTAARLLFRMMAGETVPDVTTLNTRLMIRESCGCRTTPFWSIQNTVGFRISITDFIQSEDFTNFLNRSLRELEYLVDYPVWREKVTRLLGIIDQERNDQNSINDLTDDIFHLISEPELVKETANTWKGIFKTLREALLSSNCVLKNWQEALFNLIFIGLVQKAEKEEGQLKLQTAELLNTLRILNTRINHVQSTADFVAVIAANLPLIKINSAFLCLYRQQGSFLKGTQWAVPAISRLLLAYDHETMKMGRHTSVRFPTTQILPAGTVSQKGSTSYIVMPIFDHDRHYGYMLCELGHENEIVYEELRQLMSNVIHKILVFKKYRQLNVKLRQEMQKAREHEEFLQDLTSRLPTLVVKTDPVMRITYVNRTGMEVLALNEAELNQELVLTDFLAEETLPEFQRRSRLLAEQKESIFFVLVVRTRNGGRKTLLTKAAPLFTGNTLTAILWNALDIKTMLEKKPQFEDEFIKTYHLSGRETEVLEYLLAGMRKKDIAAKLFVSESTVKGHVASVYSKTGVSSREELFDLLHEKQSQSLSYEYYLLNILARMSGG